MSDGVCTFAIRTSATPYFVSFATPLLYLLPPHIEYTCHLPPNLKSESLQSIQQVGRQFVMKEMMADEQVDLGGVTKPVRWSRSTMEGLSLHNVYMRDFGSAASCKDHMAQCQQSQVCDFSAFWKIFSFVTFLCQTFIPQHFWQIPKCKCSGACNCENLSDLLHNNCSLAPSSFNCDHCKKSFANDKNLARHVEKFHRG